MTTWAEQFGADPTSDPDRIEAWASDPDVHLAVALNDLPADGPVHPATLWLGREAVLLECAAIGRRAAFPPTFPEAEDAARVGQAWGCTYMVLEEAPE